MLIKDFLENVCNEIKYKPIRNDISEELSLHIQEQKEEYIKYGLEEKNAEERAVSNMGDAQEIGKKLNKIHRPKFDWILTLLVLILIGFGFLIITIRGKQEVDTISFNYLQRPILFFALGLIISIGIYFLDYRRVLKYSTAIYVISSIILIVTALFGRNIGGRNYLSIFHKIIDPANICILLYIIAFVGFLNRLNGKYININVGKFNFKFRLDILELIALAIISIFLMMIGNRITITIILLLSYIFITTAHIAKGENKKINLIKFYGALFLVILIFMIFLGVTNSGAYSRIVQRGQATYNYYDSGYSNSYGWINKIVNDILNNSKPFSGIENADEYIGLLTNGTEFALITIIMYYGTFYASIVITAVILLGIKIILDCRKIKDEEGRLLVIGFGSFIVLQAIFNILMNFNLIPIAALNLPFVSYGLNGLVVNMMMIAFILSIYRRKDVLTKKVNDDKKLKIKISFE